MDFRLVVLRGRSASQTVLLGDGATTIGRHDDCQLRIRSSQVSRKHCRLTERGNKLVVEDLGSSNGTFVNGIRLESATEVGPGDTLTIGPVSFRVDHPGMETPPTAAAAAAAASPAAGDTAIVEALIDDGGDEEEFELDFDEVPAPAPAAHAAPAPAPTAPSAPAAEKAPEPKKQEAAEDMGDDAVADFLMNIKIDDE